jgi:hypothetical protein
MWKQLQWRLQFVEEVDPGLLGLEDLETRVPSCIVSRDMSIIHVLLRKVCPFHYES